MSAQRRPPGREAVIHAEVRGGLRTISRALMRKFHYYQLSA